MLELLKRILTGQNQFASGGLVLMIIGGISVYLRAMPVRIWEWIVDQSTMSLTIKDDDAAFIWVKEWFLDQRFLKRVRRLDVDTTLQGRSVALIPAPGRHWFWRSSRPFRVDLYRSEEANAMRPRRHEFLCFRTIGRQQKIVWHFVNEIVDCHRKNAVRSWLYVYDDGWSRVAGYVPRGLDSVSLGLERNSVCWMTSRSSGALGSVTVASECLTTEGICSVAHRGAAKHPWSRLSLRGLACRSMRSTWPTSTIARW